MSEESRYMKCKNLNTRICPHQAKVVFTEAESGRRQIQTIVAVDTTEMDRICMECNYFK